MCHPHPSAVYLNNGVPVSEGLVREIHQRLVEGVGDGLVPPDIGSRQEVH